MDISHGLENIDIKASSGTVKKLEGLQFHYIFTNVAGPGCHTDPNLVCFEGCDCTSRSCSQEDCTCNLSNYEDKMLKNLGSDSHPIYECNISCKCSDVCQNRLVQNGVCQPLEIFDTDLKGFGVRVLKSVTQGAFVCEYAGEVIDQNEAMKRTKIQADNSMMNYIISVSEYYSHSHETSLTYIDPKYKGNVGRFLNHSCDPNLVMVPVRVNSTVPHLALFACRDIVSGEELTFNYGDKKSHTKIDETDFVRKICLCGSDMCTGYLPLDGCHLPES